MHYFSPHAFYQRWAKRLISLYPASWRERYAEEMLLILEDSPPTLKTVGNLLLHLFDAYIHRDLVKRRMTPMLQRMRSHEVTIYSATFIFFVAWFLAQLRITAPGHQPRNLSYGFSYIPSYPFISIIHFISWLLLLFVLLGGLPILLAACGKALRERRIGALLFCLLGLVSPLITTILLTGFQTTISILPWPLGYFVGLSLDMLLIFLAVQRVAPSRRITHYVFFLATLIPLVMFLGIVILTFMIIPSLDGFTPRDAIAYIMRQGTLIFIMTMALIISLVSLRKSFQAKQSAQAMPPQEIAIMH